MVVVPNNIATAVWIVVVAIGIVLLSEGYSKLKAWVIKHWVSKVKA